MCADFYTGFDSTNGEEICFVSVELAKSNSSNCMLVSKEEISRGGNASVTGYVDSGTSRYISSIRSDFEFLEKNATVRIIGAGGRANELGFKGCLQGLSFQLQKRLLMVSFMM